MIHTDFPERLAMDRTFELLAKVLDTEQAACEHAMACKRCDGVPVCPTGRLLMGKNIEATLEAKMYVDAVRRAALTPDPRKVELHAV